MTELNEEALFQEVAFVLEDRLLHSLLLTLQLLVRPPTTETSKTRKWPLRAEHHRTILHRCHQAHVVPNGLKLNRKFLPIRGDGLSSISLRIKEIIKKAEEDTLMVHYQQVTETTSSRLVEIEQNHVKTHTSIVLVLA